MKLRYNVIKTAFDTSEIILLRSFSSVLMTIIAEYLTILPFWEKLLKDTLLAKQSVLNKLQYSIIELFNKNFFEVLSLLDQKGNEKFEIKLYSYHENHTHYCNGTHFDAFDLVFDALYKLCSFGVEVKSYSEKSRYNLLYCLQTLELIKPSMVSPQIQKLILPELKELILLLPHSQEFLLDEIDIDILLKYFEPEGRFKISRDEIFLKFNQWLPMEQHNIPIYYFEPEEKGISLVLLEGSFETIQFMKKIPAYKNDWFIHEKRQSYADETKIIHDWVPLPTALHTLIIHYITDGQYLSFLARELMDLLPILEEKYFSKVSPLPWYDDFLKKLAQTLQAIIDNHSVGILASIEPDIRQSWDICFEFKATRHIERLIRGFSTSQRPFHLLKFLNNLAIKESPAPIIDKFISDLLELTNMSVFRASRSLLANQCPHFVYRNIDHTCYAYDLGQKDLHQFLSQQGCQKPHVDYACDDKLTDQVFLYFELDTRVISALECFSYYQNIQLSESFFNFVLHLIGLTDDGSKKKQIERMTTMITTCIPKEFDLIPESVHVTKIQKSTPEFNRYQACLKIPYCQVKQFRLFETQSVENSPLRSRRLMAAR